MVPGKEEEIAACDASGVGPIHQPHEEPGSDHPLEEVRQSGRSRRARSAYSPVPAVSKRARPGQRTEPACYGDRRHHGAEPGQSGMPGEEGRRYISSSKYISIYLSISMSVFFQ